MNKTELELLSTIGAGDYLNATAYNIRKDGKGIERKINDLIFEQNLKVMKKEELIKKLDNLIKSNNEINYNEEMTSEELENLLKKYDN